MQRILEPELMEEDDQARAYAEADFEEPHSRFISTFRDIFHFRDINGYVLDLGCGPGDISIRFAKAYSDCIVHGIDGSEAMLFYGKKAIASSPAVQNRVQLFRKILPTKSLPRPKYDVIISNSLLHHLPNPQILWDTIKLYAVSGTPVFVMDLKRPDTIAEARNLTEKYTSNEPEILQRDFHSSLLAAFKVNEVKQEIKIAGLKQLSVKSVSDRHLIIYGKI